MTDYAIFWEWLSFAVRWTHVITAIAWIGSSFYFIALVTGLSVADTSENAIANLGWEEVELPRPVFVGDTLWAESEVLALRPSASRREVGIVTVRTAGTNQDGETVITFRRSFMLPRTETS